MNELAAGQTRSRTDETTLSVMNFLQKPAILGSFALINCLNFYAQLKGHDNTAEFMIAGMGAEASIGALGMFAYAKAKQRRKDRAQEETYSQQANFGDYVRPNEDGVWQSPFLVSVIGIRQEILGLGKVIGGLSESNGDTPVIAIPDHHAPKGIVELRGDECWWVPANEEIVDHSVHLMVNGMTMLATDYQKSLSY